MLVNRVKHCNKAGAAKSSWPLEIAAIIARAQLPRRALAETACRVTLKGGTPRAAWETREWFQVTPGLQRGHHFNLVKGWFVSWLIVAGKPQRILFNWDLRTKASTYYELRFTIGRNATARWQHTKFLRGMRLCKGLAIPVLQAWSLSHHCRACVDDEYHLVGWPDHELGIG